MGWERKDYIAIAALVVSTISLIGTITSGVFGIQQVRLNEERDRRELASRGPVFEVNVQKLDQSGLYSLQIDVTNRNNARIIFYGVDLWPGTDAVFATRQGGKVVEGGHEAPPEFWENVDPNSNRTRRGLLKLEKPANDQSQKGAIMFSYKFADNDNERFTHVSEFHFY